MYVRMITADGDEILGAVSMDRLPGAGELVLARDGLYRVTNAAITNEQKPLSSASSSNGARWITTIVVQPEFTSATQKRQR